MNTEQEINIAWPCCPDSRYTKASSGTLHERSNLKTAFWLWKLRKPRRDFRLPSSDFRLPTSDFRLPTSDFPLRTSDFRLPTSDFRLQTSDFRLPTSDFRLPTSDFRLPTSDFRLQISDANHRGVKLDEATCRWTAEFKILYSTVWLKLFFIRCFRRKNI